MAAVRCRARISTERAAEAIGQTGGPHGRETLNTASDNRTGAADNLMRAAGRATADDSPVLHAAIGLAQQIQAASEEIERGRRLPPSIAAAMKDAGVFGMAMPRVWGGPELDPLTQFRVIEALALAERSVGWC